MNQNYNNMFSIETLPYLYQSERLSSAWGHLHFGFFIDPNGVKYQYKMDKNYRYAITDIWNWFETSKEGKHPTSKTSWGYEEDGIIMPSKLFENLGNSIKSNPWFKRKKENILITPETIHHLLDSKIDDYGQMMCDAGHWSNSLYVYEAENNFYRRILLSCDADIKKVNTSQYTKTIEARLGTIK